MAHYCSCCESLFDRPWRNCPVCGSRLRSDERPDSELESEGYHHVSRAAELDAPDVSARSAGAGNADFYSRLQEDYQKQLQRDRAQRAAGSRPRDYGSASSSSLTKDSSSQSSAFRPVTPPVIPEITEEPGEESGGFFSQFQQGSGPTEVPEEIPRTAQEEEAVRELEEHAAEVRAASRRARRARFHARWVSQPSRGSVQGRRGLRWLVFALVIVLILVFLWKARYAIAAAIWNVIRAFMPSIIIILGIIWLIRSMFRRR